MVMIRFVRERGEHAGGIERLLAEADDSFVPALTASGRSDVERSGEEGGGTDIRGYVDRCLERAMVGAFDGDRLVGFASFHELADTSALDGYTPTNHVSIIVVDSDYRGRGIGTRIYRHLLGDLPPERERPFVSTKTWSTNHGHLAILDSLGFECVERVPDDRGPGVDTVYYARSV